MISLAVRPFIARYPGRPDRPGLEDTLVLPDLKAFPDFPGRLALPVAQLAQPARQVHRAPKDRLGLLARQERRAAPALLAHQVHPVQLGPPARRGYEVWMDRPVPPVRKEFPEQTVRLARQDLRELRELGVQLVQQAQPDRLARQDQPLRLQWELSPQVIREAMLSLPTPAAETTRF